MSGVESSERIAPVARTSRGFLWRFARIAGSVYLGMLLVLMLFESWLVYPAPRYPDGNWSPDFPHEDVHFKSADGTVLQGWLMTQPAPRYWVLFLHGNGEHVPAAAESMRAVSRRLQANIFVFDYRGYGRSGGRPHEKGVLQDGQAALDWLAARAGVPSDQIIVQGRSLGGAVAIDLAARNTIRALVLERTFTRLTDAAAYHFPWIPVRQLMRNRYPSIDKIHHCRAPLLISHGTLDEVIPFTHGEQLFAAASGRKQFMRLEGVRHNDPNPESYWTQLEAFLADTSAASETSD